ncbi:hypothetical protein GCM10025858_07330 [Alicyclobacillus sacchari]|nr:hypothetical protein GCM10025858_07330 [Alicyclobacillus sacchari]
MATPGVNQFMRVDEAVLDKVERLVAIADQAGISLAQMAIAWTLRLENVASALVGASLPEQVVENAKAAGVKLSQDVIDAIEKALV